MQLGRVLAAALVALVLPVECWADWTRLETPHFTFIGDASEGRIRQTAQKLEQFRDVILRVLSNATGTSPKPTVVFVFRRDRSFTPFKPTFQGRVTDVAGYFIQTDEATYIAVNAEADDSGLSTIFHEYSHFLADNTLGDLPVWVSEGLAQFFETVEARDGGRVAIVGNPILDHVEMLLEEPPMPMRELVAVDHESPVYNEGERRGVFYAQSWAAVHYLITSRARSGQIDGYLTRLRGGMPPDQAFREAFGGEPDGLDDEVRAYLRQFSMSARRLDLGERAAGLEDLRGERISDMDADVYLGALQAAVGRRDEARARLEVVLAASPDAPRALAALGLVELREGDVGAAVARLQRAGEAAPEDGVVQSALGRALVARLDTLEPGDDGFEPTLRRAREVLGRAVSLQPGVAHTAALAGFTELVAGQDLARADELLSGAVALAPTRDDYRLMLAQVYLRQGDLDRSTSVLGRLLARGNGPEVRERARQLLGVVAQARAAPAAPGAGRAGGSAPAGSGPRLDLREPRPGESQVLGTLTAIECRGNAITAFVIETGARTWRLRNNPDRAASLRSYGPSPRACGSLDGAFKALATYVDPPGETEVEAPVDGDAVAIEIVPEGFALPN